MNTSSALLLGAFSSLLLPACLALPVGDSGCQHADCAQSSHASVPVQAQPVQAERIDPAPVDDEADAWARSLAEPSVLYSRDGTPVQQASSAASVPLEPPGMLDTRDVERPETGRLYLLELYQQAVDERDDLLDEVMRQEAFLLELRTANAVLVTQVSEVQAHSMELDADKQRAEQQSFELASRLTAAQIGRLQAELRQLRAESEMLDPGGMIGARLGSDPSMLEPERASGQPSETDRRPR
ncbi:MAG: hypothetical protein ACI8QZ_000008 [Chlamydiales bacterium]|jgi:hypothetical protein